MHDLVVVELIDIEYYRDLEMWVRGHIGLSIGWLYFVPFSSYLTLNNRDLESWVIDY